MERIEWPSVDKLNEIDLSELLKNIPDGDEFKFYFNLLAGKEHYRLLTWLSDVYSGKNIVEIGVFKGFSGLAFAKNPQTNVTGFDIGDYLNCKLPSNYKFIKDDYKKYPEIIKQAEVIFYDTNHDGVLEVEFIEFLKQINYTGMVLFDDIHLNSEMVVFWNNIKTIYPSMDITHIGHCVGTGVIWI